MKKLFAFLTVFSAAFWAGCGTDSASKATFITLDSTTNTPQVSILSADGKTSTKADFTLTTDMFFITVSPDAKSVAYCKNADSGTQIFLLGQDGHEKQLTTVGESCVPSFSWDGRKIAFESIRNGDIDQIFTMNADGTNQTKIFASSTGYLDEFPQFSPDGKTLVFYREDFGTPITQRASAWRAQATQSRAGLARYHRMMSRAKPSGTVGGSTLGIWTVKTNGSDPFQVASIDSVVTPAVFSADGKKLLYSSVQFGDIPQIVSVKLDGTSPVNLSNDTTQVDIAPVSWGSHILFNRLIYNQAEDTDFADVMQMEVDGSHQLNLTNTSDKNEFLWGFLSF